MNKEADQTSPALAYRALVLVFGLEPGITSSLPSGKGRYQFEVELWLQFHVQYLSQVTYTIPTNSALSH